MAGDAATRLLRAARDVLARDGVAGLTTRAIAAEAGVNEVTLFRHFGSKSALLDAALAAPDAVGAANPLPERASDPEATLAAWAQAEVARLSAARELLLHSLAAAPGTGACVGDASLLQLASAVQRDLHDRVHAFVRALPVADDADAEAAVAMFCASLVTDAVRGTLVPHGFPEAPPDAPARYARVLLRAIGASAIPSSTRPTTTR